jgi:hypothetical protein
LAELIESAGHPNNILGFLNQFHNRFGFINPELGLSPLLYDQTGPTG